MRVTCALLYSLSSARTPRRFAAGVEHEVLADQAAGIGQSVREAAAGGIQQQPRRLRAIRARHDCASLLEMLALVRSK